MSEDDASGVHKAPCYKAVEDGSTWIGFPVVWEEQALCKSSSCSVADPLVTTKIDHSTRGPLSIRTWASALGEPCLAVGLRMLEGNEHIIGSVPCDHNNHQAVTTELLLANCPDKLLVTLSSEGHLLGFSLTEDNSAERPPDSSVVAVNLSRGVLVGLSAHMDSGKGFLHSLTCFVGVWPTRLDFDETVVLVGYDDGILGEKELLQKATSPPNHEDDPKEVQFNLVIKRSNQTRLRHPYVPASCAVGLPTDLLTINSPAYGETTLMTRALRQNGELVSGVLEMTANVKGVVKPGLGLCGEAYGQQVTGARARAHGKAVATFPVRRGDNVSFVKLEYAGGMLLEASDCAFLINVDIRTNDSA